MGGADAVIETTKGDIKVELYEGEAPRTVANFIALAKEGYFDDMPWHRVEAGFVIQTGQGDPRATIPDEVNRHKHGPGILAMAKPGAPPGSSRMSEKDGASTQFYICLRSSADSAYLNEEYTCFGRVTDGLSVARNITTADKVKTIRAK